MLGVMDGKGGGKKRVQDWQDQKKESFFFFFFQGPKPTQISQIWKALLPSTYPSYIALLPCKIRSWAKSKIRGYSISISVYFCTCVVFCCRLGYVYSFQCSRIHLTSSMDIFCLVPAYRKLRKSVSVDSWFEARPTNQGVTAEAPLE